MSLAIHFSHPRRTMFRFALFLLLIALACGCGKKPAPAPADTAKANDKPGTTPPPVDETTAWRNKQLATIKVNNQENRRIAMDELAWLVSEDAEVGPALLELLKDKGTAGAGRTLTNQINSTREAAAIALLKAGPKGEALLKEKGLEILRAQLADTSPVIREHTVYTIAQLGVFAKPLAGDVQKLCTDTDANVRGVAFDALRVTGVPDPVALVKLLKHSNEEVVRLAAELIPLMPELPADAVAPLSAALASENTNVQTAAANGLALVGPKAVSAVPLLIEAINKYYPKEYDPKAPRFDAVESAYWLALTRIGEAAVLPTAKLLEHTNILVRSFAARTLGDIGAPAKSAKDALKKALADTTINVSAEAAVTLCKLGESPEESLNLLKRAIDFADGGIAAYAIEAVSRIGDAGKPLVPQILGKLTSQNAATRYAVVSYIGTQEPAEAAKSAAELGKLATDAEPEIKRLVARVLTRLGTNAAPAADALGKALTAETDLDTREQFVDALHAMGAGAKPALAGLLPLVAEKNLTLLFRAKVIGLVALADPASPEVATALLQAATDTDPAIRAASATAMGRLNPLPTNALDALVKMAKSDSKNATRLAALRAMTTAGTRAKAAKPELEAIAAGPLPGAAVWAKVALVAIEGDVKKAAPLVRSSLNERNPAIRASAAEALLLVGVTNEDLPTLLKLMKEGSGSTREAAAIGVGQLGATAKDAVPALTRLLDDNEAAVRLAAVESLAKIGPASRPALEKLKGLRFDPTVRAAAQRAITTIEGK